MRPRVKRLERTLPAQLLGAGEPDPQECQGLEIEAMVSAPPETSRRLAVESPRAWSPVFCYNRPINRVPGGATMESSSRAITCALIWVLLTTLFAGCTGGEDQTFVDPEVCDNGVDDDADGLTDCADSDCRDAEACAGEATEHCYDLVDNDADGSIDCDDEECASRVICTERLETCTSGADDDGDGLADCADDDCSGTAYCTQNGEQCTNGVDDDGDGEVDCEDANCANTRLCGTQPESCTGGIDEDGDGQVDCDDDDCGGTQPCVDSGELCTNAVDDDADGRVDCLDPDCAYTSACLGAREDCENGLDDDGDGLVDCADDACRSTPVCQDSGELCDNGLDDDDDGQVDCDDDDCLDRGVCELCANGEDDDGNGAADCNDSACWFSDDCSCSGVEEDTDGDGVPECYEDADGDGVLDPADNCPQIPNPAQDYPDGESSGPGAACFDPDGDGVPARVDNCPGVANPSQTDRDDYLNNTERVGDACDTDFNFYTDNMQRQFLAWRGSANATRFGDSVARLEDFDGDQQNDLVVGTPQEGDHGVVRIYFGPAPPASAKTDETGADVEIRYVDQGGATSGGMLGLDLAPLGDINGDGLSDLAVATQGGAIRRAYVFFGGQTGSLDVSSADVTIDLTAAPGDTRPLRINTVGDIDGDGLQDLFVSSDAGWLIFGGAQLSGTPQTLTATDAAVDFTTDTDPTPTLLADDLVGDSTPELVRLSPDAAAGAGKLSFYLTGDPTTDLFGEPATDVLQSQNQPSDKLGRGYGVGGDLDGNGATDVFVASSYNDAGDNRGQIEVFDVGSSGLVRRRSLEPPDAANYTFGGPIDTRTDLSGDGTLDLVATNPGGLPRVVVILGEDIASTQPSETPTARVFRFASRNSLTGPFGTPRVLTTGDWTGDGLPDLLTSFPEFRGSTSTLQGGIFVWPNVWHESIR